ncbi:hypothetical protein CVCC1112_1143 [Paenarthrobacter nicotinovorans]|nr:hypothetical protein CVCC1112_1143 [Paenarthrobacter nicotinovorans]
MRREILNVLVATSVVQSGSGYGTTSNLSRHEGRAWLF